MIRRLIEKWFGLTPVSCESCAILRDQLDKSEMERRELLHRLLDQSKSEPPPVTQSEEFKAITPPFIPWRVKQQMLEQEDRARARLMKEKQKEISDSRLGEIDKLEKELGVE